MILLDAIGLEAEVVTFTRHGQGTRELGVVEPGPETTFDAVVSVQPLSPREARMLPEGIRQQGALVLYGADELRAPDTRYGRRSGGDEFTRGGHTYEVISVEDWVVHGGFYRSIAAKVER